MVWSTLYEIYCAVPFSRTPVTAMMFHGNEEAKGLGKHPPSLIIHSWLGSRPTFWTALTVKIALLF